MTGKSSDTHSVYWLITSTGYLSADEELALHRGFESYETGNSNPSQQSFLWTKIPSSNDTHPTDSYKYHFASDGLDGSAMRDAARTAYETRLESSLQARFQVFDKVCYLYVSFHRMFVLVQHLLA